MQQQPLGWARGLGVVARIALLKRIAVGLALTPLAILAGQYLGERAAGAGPQQVRGIEDAQLAEVAKASGVDDEIATVATSQDAQGLDESDLTPAYLRGLEAWTVERLRVNALRGLAEEGDNRTDIEIEANSVYVFAGPLKLAVTRVMLDGRAFLVSVVGVVGSELRRVGCVRDSAEPIPITSGPCAKKIRDTFGASVGDP